MARITNSDGLIMNQSNGNAYMRVYARGRVSPTAGKYLRFTVSGGNPNIHLVAKIYFAFTQTNNSYDFPSANTWWKSFQCDTGGNMNDAFSGAWLSGANIGWGWTFPSLRVADLYLVDVNNNGWPGNASMCAEIFCDRWDYVTVSNLD